MSYSLHWSLRSYDEGRKLPFTNSVKYVDMKGEQFAYSSNCSDPEIRANMINAFICGYMDAHKLTYWEGVIRTAA